MVLKGSKDIEKLGPVLQSKLVSGYGATAAKLPITLYTAPIWRRVISSYCIRTASGGLAGKRFVTHADVKQTHLLITDI
jgi:hypothetical protein